MDLANSRFKLGKNWQKDALEKLKFLKGLLLALRLELFWTTNHPKQFTFLVKGFKINYDNILKIYRFENFFTKHCSL